MLQEYNKQKENLLAIYDMLKENKSDFIDLNLKVEILEKKDSLVKDQFILAVAGQMKSGKSTLLNALIFGDDILPADDTELTAKITFITYDETPSYEAVLYTKSEFDELRNSMRGTDGEVEFNNQINTTLESLQNQGYSSYEEILAKKIITGKNLKDLIDFVGKNGIYTPFVNTLTLKTNSNWVKNIVVVDTPGMNSPNKLRDKVVKDWIVKADAVVYCSYAGRALDATDLEFVKDYMLHISSKHRLFALTKSDLINGEDKLMNTIANMIKADWNMKYDLIPSKDIVFPVCQMAVLLDKMDKSNVPFTPRMEEEYELIESRIDFDQSHKQFSYLENAIEKKLIANKDSNIIETHQQYLSTIFSESYQESKEDLDSCSKSLDLVNSDKNELKIIEQKIKNDIKNFQENIETVEKGILNYFDEALNEIKIKKEFNDAYSKIIKKLEDKSLDDLGKFCAPITDENLSNCIVNIKYQAKSFSKNFSKGLKRLFEKTELPMEYLNSDLIKERIEIKCNSFINEKTSDLKVELGEASRSLKETYTSSLGNWRKVKDFWKSKERKGKERGIEALQKFIVDSLNPISKKFDSIEKNFKAELSNSVQEIINQVQEENNKLLDEKQEEIISLNNIKGDEIEERRKSYQKEFEELRSQQKKLESLIETINSKIKFTEL